MVDRNRGLGPKVSVPMRRLSCLRGVLANRIFELIEEFSGVTDLQLAIFTSEKMSRIEATISQLMDGNLLVRHPLYPLSAGEFTPDGEYWKARMREIAVENGITSHVALPEPAFHMHYLSDEGTIVVSHRDRTSLKGIRARVHEDIRKDHYSGDQNQWIHTLHQNACLAAMAAAGHEVFAGYRARLYLSGNRQLVPDGCITAVRDLGEHVVEWVRGTHRDPAFRRKVRAQLEKYIPYAGGPQSLEVICVCEREATRSIVQEEADAMCQEYQVNLDVATVLERMVSFHPAREGVPEGVYRVDMRFQWLVEYERTAVNPGDVRNKLMPLVRVAPDVPSLRVIFICETQTAGKTFEEVHKQLQEAHGVSFALVTSTLERVTKELRKGSVSTLERGTKELRKDSVWSMDGKPVWLT